MNTALNLRRHLGADRFLGSRHSSTWNIRRFEEEHEAAVFGAISELCAQQVPLVQMAPINMLPGEVAVILSFCNGVQVIAQAPHAAGIEELACCASRTAAPYHCSRPGQFYLMCFKSPRGLILLAAESMTIEFPAESMTKGFYGGGTCGRTGS